MWPERNTSTDGSAAAIPRASGSYRGDPFSGFTHTTLCAKPPQPRHLRPQQLRIPSLQPVRAQHHDRAPERRALAPPVQERLQRLADPRPALPVGHRPADLAERAVGVFRAERSRHAREPRTEAEHLHAPARRHRGVAELHQRPRVRRHRAAHVEDQHERTAADAAVAPCPLERLPTRPQRPPQRPADVEPGPLRAKARVRRIRCSGRAIASCRISSPTSSRSSSDRSAKDFERRTSTALATIRIAASSPDFGRLVLLGQSVPFGGGPTGPHLQVFRLVSPVDALPRERRQVELDLQVLGRAERCGTSPRTQGRRRRGPPSGRSSRPARPSRARGDRSSRARRPPGRT